MKFKRLFSILLCTLFLLSYSASAATSSNSSSSNFVSPDEFFSSYVPTTPDEIHSWITADVNAVTTNEFESIKNAQVQAMEALRSDSLTEIQVAEMNAILEIDLASKVYSLQNKSDEELHSLGLDDERISIIRTFKGTDAELYALSANCTVSGTPKYTKNNTGNWAKVTFAFEWDKPPFWNYTDALLASANSTFLIQRTEDTSCTINYSALGATGSEDYSLDYTYTDLVINPFSENLIGGFPFPCAETKFNSDNYPVSYYSMNGSSVIVFKSVDQNQVGLSFGHAHATRKITVSPYISFSGNASVNFGLTEKFYDVTAKALDSYTFNN